MKQDALGQRTLQNGQMTEREQEIFRCVGKVLERMPGRVCADSVLFNSTAMLFENMGHGRLLRTEFEAVLSQAESNLWVKGIRSAIGTVKWTLSDVGRAVLLES